MKDYGLILLDADDTLFDYKEAERIALTRACETHGLPCGEDRIAVYGSINRELWLQYERGEISQRDLRSERFRRLFRNEPRVPDPVSFSEAYLAELAAAAVLCEGAEETCAWLAQRFLLAIITNGIAAVQRSRFEKSAIRPFISHLIISEEAGVSKPHTGIFAYAEGMTGFSDRNAMLIVGDSLSSDIQGGVNWGIDTCWVDPSGTQGPVTPSPTWRIRNIAGLRSVLEARD